ncbi:MAG: hypothetical protein ACFFD1_02495 [Candidatus Thorarchaeota archaeon]
MFSAPMQHWAIFIEIDEVKWSFGIKGNQEFLDTSVRFIQSLQAIGRELYEQGVASIKLATTQGEFLSTKEVFIINLSDQFFFIISDLFITSKLIAETTTIPYDIEQIICAVLVGQAAIIYSYLKQNEFDSGYDTDGIFRSLLAKMKLPYDLDSLVADGRCSLSPLNFQELLLFHYFLRNYFELQLLNTTSNKKDSWAIMVDKDGTDIPLSYLTPKDPLLLGNFLGAIYSYVQALFGVKPQALVFGGHELIFLQYFGGKKYFLAASNPKVIFSDKMFTKLLTSIPSEKLEDITSAINEFIIQSSSIVFEENLRKKVEINPKIDGVINFYNNLLEGEEISLGKGSDKVKKIRKKPFKRARSQKKKKY